jgi:hypothetical protein
VWANKRSPSFNKSPFKPQTTHSPQHSPQHSPTHSPFDMGQDEGQWGQGSGGAQGSHTHTLAGGAGMRRSPMQSYSNKAPKRTFFGEPLETQDVQDIEDIEDIEDDAHDTFINDPVSVKFGDLEAPGAGAGGAEERGADRHTRARPATNSSNSSGSRSREGREGREDSDHRGGSGHREGREGMHRGEIPTPSSPYGSVGYAPKGDPELDEQGSPTPPIFRLEHGQKEVSDSGSEGKADDEEEGEEEEEKEGEEKEEKEGEEKGGEGGLLYPLCYTLPTSLPSHTTLPSIPSPPLPSIPSTHTSPIPSIPSMSPPNTSMGRGGMADAGRQWSVESIDMGGGHLSPASPALSIHSPASPTLSVPSMHSRHLQLPPLPMLSPMHSPFSSGLQLVGEGGQGGQGPVGGQDQHQHQGQEGRQGGQQGGRQQEGQQQGGAEGGVGAQSPQANNTRMLSIGSLEEEDLSSHKSTK